MLEVRETPDGLLLTAAPVFTRTAPGAAWTILPAPAGPARTLADMDQAIAGEVARRHAGGRYSGRLGLVGVELL